MCGGLGPTSQSEVVSVSVGLGPTSQSEVVSMCVGGVGPTSQSESGELVCVCVGRGGGLGPTSR